VAERLYRSRDERIFGGVAGGIAENLDLDPTIVRIGWVLLTLVAPIAPLFYFILLFLIPEEPEARPGSPLTAVVDPPPAPATPAAVPSPATTPAAVAAPATTPAAMPSSPTLVADDAAQRRADRDARRETHRVSRATFGIPGGLIFGILLIVVGAWFLARRWLPQLDTDAWTPLIVIAFGVVLIALAMRPGGRSAD
jgi:phage shock protein PspC (stress-responsive transcriptional regulator)